jgi:hypothetical protein
MEAQNYDFFEFCSIVKEIKNQLNEEARYIQFSVLVEAFNQYNKSNFPSLTESKYDCIKSFLNQSKKQDFISNIHTILDINSKYYDGEKELIDDLEEEISKYKKIIRLFY